MILNLGIGGGLVRKRTLISEITQSYNSVSLSFDSHLLSSLNLLKFPQESTKFFNRLIGR